jgi:hypothetical protein
VTGAPYAWSIPFKDEFKITTGYDFRREKPKLRVAYLRTAGATHEEFFPAYDSREQAVTLGEPFWECDLMRLAFSLLTATREVMLGLRVQRRPERKRNIRITAVGRTSADSTHSMQEVKHYFGPAFEAKA